MLARALGRAGCSVPSSPRCTSSRSGAFLGDSLPQPLHPVLKCNAQIICKVLGGGGREGDGGGSVCRLCAGWGPRAGEIPHVPLAQLCWLAICFNLSEFAGSEPPASVQTLLNSSPPPSGSPAQPQTHRALSEHLRSVHVPGASLMHTDTG